MKKTTMIAICSITLFALASLCWPSPMIAEGVNGQEKCRSFREQSPNELSRIVAANREVHPSVDFVSDSVNDRFVVTGLLCDVELNPIGERTVTLAEVTRSEDYRGPVSEAAIEQGEVQIRETNRVNTDSAGLFSLRGLRPGEYALLSEWKEDEGVLVYDIRLLPGPPLYSPVSMVSHTQP